MRREWRGIGVGLLVAVSFAACSDAGEDRPGVVAGDAEVRCPEVPVWNRSARGANDAAALSSSPEEAVVAVAPDVSIVSSSADGKWATVQVTGGAGDGSYEVRRLRGGWYVTGGDGCGAMQGNPTLSLDCDPQVVAVEQDGWLAACPDH